jgi:hypothetical protein
MTELRELRRAADLPQHEFAALMSVLVNTFRSRSCPARLRRHQSRIGRGEGPGLGSCHV